MGRRYSGVRLAGCSGCSNPKEGDLKQCDHWCGISLLDVVGKALGRIVLRRLQVIAENILPESQSGFRKGCGCADMIFVARQLVENHCMCCL